MMTMSKVLETAYNIRFRYNKTTKATRDCLSKHLLLAITSVYLPYLVPISPLIIATVSLAQDLPSGFPLRGLAGMVFALSGCGQLILILHGSAQISPTQSSLLQLHCGSTSDTQLPSITSLLHFLPDIHHSWHAFIVHLLSSLSESELQEGRDQARHHPSSTENSIFYIEVWKSAETNPMKTSKGSAFRVCSNKEPATITYVLAEIQRQAEEWNARSWGKGKASGVP